MKFSTIVLLGVFVFGVSTSFAQEEPTTEKAETSVIPETDGDTTKITTSTVLPITTSSLVPDPDTTTSSPNTSTTTKPETTTIPPTTKPTTTTTVEPSTSTSTTQPSPTTTAIPNTTVVPPAHHTNHWSTTSFIGGIVFAFGLSAIGFVAWKFYKARNERNYHTL